MDWPYEKLARWLIHDEMEWMVARVKSASKGMDDAMARDIVRWEQDKNGWVGVFATEDKSL